MSNIKGKRALITGATKGIGLALSLAFLKEGVNAFLVGQNFDLLNTKLGELSDTHGSFQLMKADLTRDEDIAHLINEIGDHAIDILIHCAGVIALGPFESLDVKDFDRQYQVNVRAPFVLTQKLLPRLRKTMGDIVFINSTAGIDSWKNISQYSASKHALKAMVNALMKEVSKDKIRIINVFLGSVDTSMQQTIQKQLGNNNYNPDSYMHPDVLAQVILSLINIPESITITDITIKPNA